MKMMMKSMMAVAAFCLCGATAMAQDSEATDNDDKGVSIGDWEFSLPFTSVKKKRHYEISGSDYVYEASNGFFLGLCDAVGGPNNMDVSLGSSVEIGVQNLIQAHISWDTAPRTSVSIGLGFGWKNYRMRGTDCFFKDEYQNITITPYSAVFSNYKSAEFSRLKIFSWQIPVLYHYSLSKQIGITAGGILNINGDGSIKTRYNDVDMGRQKVIQKDIHTNPLTVDLFGAVGIYGVSLYVKYNPCNILDTNHAPKFNSMSMGLMIPI